MATLTPPLTVPESLAQSDSTSPAHASPSTRPGPSPTKVAIRVMAIAIALVFGGSTAVLYAVGDVQLDAAVGLGAFLAFWLGGGFGLIVSSAVIFSGHEATRPHPG